MQIPEFREKTVQKYRRALIFLFYKINSDLKNQVSLSEYCRVNKLNRNFRIAIIKLGLIENYGTTNNRKYRVLVNEVTRQMAIDVLIFSDAKSKKLEVIIDEKITLWDCLKNFFIKPNKSNVLSLKSYKQQTLI